MNNQPDQPTPRDPRPPDSPPPELSGPPPSGPLPPSLLSPGPLARGPLSPGSVSREASSWPSSGPRERTAEDVRWGRVERRRERIRADIRRNRQGGHKVPTWVLAVLLGLLLAGWLYLIFTE